MKKAKEIIYMNRNEVAEAVKEFPVAVMPIGSTEQHGYHLPLGTDIFLAEGISRKLCENTGAILLPSMPYGYSWVWRDIPGTVSLKEKNVERVINDAAKSLSRYGVKLFIIVNGHDANNAAMKYAVRDLEDELDMKVIYLFYPSANSIMKQYCESETWYGMFHACEFETSLMLALRPELVNMNKAVREYPDKPNLYGKSTIALENLSNSGVFGDPTVATREKGEKMLELFVKIMTENIFEAYNSVE